MTRYYCKHCQERLKKEADRYKRLTANDQADPWVCRVTGAAHEPRTLSP